MKNKFLLCVVLGTLFLSLQAKTLTLEECLSHAMDNNPGLRSARKKIDVAEARRGTFLDLPNTGIELTQSTLEGAGMDNGLTFSQEFEFPTVYAARRKVLKAEETIAREEYGETASRIRGEVMALYYSLAYQKSRAALMRRNLVFYSDFSKVSRVRFDVGETSRLELLNAERMMAKIEAMIEDTDVSIITLRMQLAKAIGESSPVDIADDALTVIEFEDSSLEFDPATTFNSRILSARIALTEKNTFLVRQEFLPSFSVSATSQLVIKSFNPYHVDRERFRNGDFMGFSVGVTVPVFFSGKRAQLAAAMKETEYARLQLEDQQLIQAMEFEELKNDLALAGKRLDYYEKTALGQADEMKRLAKVSYDLGEIDYLEYMQNIQSSMEIWLEYFDMIEKFNQTLIKIQTLKSN